jgi:hypothetical protein
MIYFNKEINCQQRTLILHTIFTSSLLCYFVKILCYAAKERSADIRLMMMSISGLEERIRVCDCEESQITDDNDNRERRPHRQNERKCQMVVKNSLRERKTVIESRGLTMITSVLSSEPLTALGCLERSWQ